jgi:hypothetical protein
VRSLAVAAPAQLPLAARALLRLRLAPAAVPSVVREVLSVSRAPELAPAARKSFLRTALIVLARADPG